MGAKSKKNLCFVKWKQMTASRESGDHRAFPRPLGRRRTEILLIAGRARHGCAGYRGHPSENLVQAKPSSNDRGRFQRLIVPGHRPVGHSREGGSRSVAGLLGNAQDYGAGLCDVRVSSVRSRTASRSGKAASLQGLFRNEDSSSRWTKKVGARMPFAFAKFATPSVADVDLMIDANYLFNPVEAKLLCRAIEECNITWFEEPLQQNDARALADLRAHTKIPIAAGQMEGHRWRLRELVEKQAVDILQPNCCFCGGFTEARKAAHLAQIYNLPIANGGGWPLFNMHTFAGLMNGWIVEWHLGMVQVGQMLFENPPEPKNGMLTIPNAPGLGLTLNRDALRKSEVRE